ncbi:histidine phosphatase family protein [Streptomyces winkii]|uniref:histidine phosphatase family protein n=1 Tax=Streptomyces winkii TaxID=3051178 RepID=UPI0028D0E3C7|nr:histidine phosphatase family protein [Streptomyces sp. DSM 40971]
MTGTAARYLYLARHAEASPDHGRLTETGRRQAVLLGDRLRRSPLAAISHGPLPRAEETAGLIGAQLDGVPVRRSEEAGDYVPHVPGRDELPAEAAGFMLDRIARLPAGEREDGPERARRALAAFAGPACRARSTSEITARCRPAPGPTSSRAWFGRVPWGRMPAVRRRGAATTSNGSSR